jgi:selenide,water dikinase
VGLEHADDSSVYKLTDDLAIVQSLDFFTPIVDDPFTFGQIAAANALSDIYAMGARPVTAMNIVGFPVDSMDKTILQEILRGGVSKVEEAGATLSGGHSIKDDEIKYGLSVTGVVHPDKLISNQGALPGDRLILTKALGTGVIATALKRQQAGNAEIQAMTDSMTTLNRIAGEVAVAFEAHALTDITGFGLVGHLLEMLDASEVSAHIDSRALPLLPQALKWSAAGMLPGGLKSNRTFYAERVAISERVDEDLAWLAFDPQTSGGLLMSVSADQAEAALQALQAGGISTAAIIGEILPTETRPTIKLS